MLDHLLEQLGVVVGEVGQVLEADPVPDPADEGTEVDADGVGAVAELPRPRLDPVLAGGIVPLFDFVVQFPTADASNAIIRIA